MKKEMKGMTNKKKPLKWSMICMLVFGWLLPLLALTLGILYFASSMMKLQVERTIQISADKAIEICQLQLNEVVTASKTASYNHVVRDSYKQYQEDQKGSKLYTQVTSFLDQQYKYDATFLCTMLFFLEDPEMIPYTYNTYRDNNNGNTGYNRVRFFMENVQESVIEEGKQLDTGIKLLEKKGHLYMIRNIVDTSFQPYAMIVIELDYRNLFGSLDSVWGEQEYEVYIDGIPFVGNEIGRNRIPDTGTVTDRSVYINDKKENIVYKTIAWEKQKLTFAVCLDRKSIIDEVEVIRYVFVVVMLFMIPLVLMVFQFFQTRVTRQISHLVEAAKEIALGEYGHQIEEESNSEEFEYLYRAFNTMSAELKYQFETIYQEELALKDANIKALQSQINPHFLNNTLEIINWEARMNGNEKVCEMIEALATMLRATMNRSQDRYVPLCDELSYVDAYLYIIKSRFGDRFHVEREVDESLMQVAVPLLIIQPIVENSVAYGVEEHKSGKVAIKIYSKEDKLYIEVINDGVLTPRDKEKIRHLLSEDENTKQEKHVSLGIRNVNRRLKIIYGDDCGLSIRSDEKNQTISTLIVGLSHESNISQ